MRQLSAQLKTIRDISKRSVQVSAQSAAQACRTAWKKPQDWWRGRKSSVSEQLERVGSDSPDTTDPSATTPVYQIKTGWRDRYPNLVKALRIALVALAVFLALPYFFILIYRFADPPFSALMLRNAVLGKSIDYKWADFPEISSNLATAAVIAEDARFCQHWGVDWTAVGDVLEDLEDGEALRGASTIPMQTAKNLFLWPDQDYLRKALEVPLAYFMTLVWPKQRVLEIYLNIAEWGPGIYGAQAAAQYHFGRSAASLNSRQSALLVAALPNPLRRNAGKPGRGTRRIASRIQRRARREGQDASCIFDR